MSRKIFDYLFLCSKYQHIRALNQLTYPVCNIRTQCKRQSARTLYILHMCCDITDLIMRPPMPYTSPPILFYVILHFYAQIQNVVYNKLHVDLT